MLALFTDFTFDGPYVGQMKAVLHRDAPGLPIIDLMHDAPAFDPQSSAYLLASLAEEFPQGTVFVAVVDPGVGTDRRPIVAEIDGRWFVGPDNGLLGILVRRAGQARAWEIAWRPARMTASFHGRDLFAPVAARVALEGYDAVPGISLEIDVSELDYTDWPDELARIIYIDGFGNGISGLRAENLSPKHRILVHNVEIKGETTFGSVPPGALFWYGNSNGLVEIASNRGRADRHLDLSVGTTVEVIGNQSVTAVI